MTQSIIKAISINASKNLQPLSKYLWSNNIPHRISENGSEQIIWATNKEDALKIVSAYADFNNGVLNVNVATANFAPIQPKAGGNMYFLTQLSQAPITILLIIISIVITLGLHGKNGEWFYASFSMQPLMLIAETGQWWRIFTPVLLHFGMLHLVFNMLMLWMFGRQLELKYSIFKFMFIILIFGIASNLAQYIVAGPNFGGMSGVVYALVGFCWLTNRIYKQVVFNIPDALMGFMIIWLIIGFTDLLYWVGLGHIANTAHLSGLIAGMLVAWLNFQFNKYSETSV